MRQIRAVFFDIGSTLVYPHPSFPAVIARVLHDNGYPVTAEQLAELEPRVFQALDQHQAAGGNFTRSDAASREFWYGVYRQFLDGLEIPDRDELPRKLYDVFVQHETYRLYPDTLPALQALSDRGILLGVISNWESWLEPLLMHLEIHVFFGGLTISGHHGVEKPDPRIFQLALDSLGVTAAEAAHVGDSVRHDVEGARAAGLLAVLIDRANRHHPRPGHYLLATDLRQLPDLLLGGGDE